MSLDRRRFVRLSAMVSGALALDLSWLKGLERASGSDRLAPGRRARGTIAVVEAAEGTDYGRGAILGIEEAGRSSQLLRRDLPIVRVRAPAAGEGDVVAWARDLVARGVAATVSALVEGQEKLERAAVAAGLVVMDARAARPDSTRVPGHNDPKPRAVFRTGLPARAYDAALRHALADRSAGDRSGSAPEGRALLWHPGLFRYGAEQLNERYRRRFGVGMTGEAWAAWMAVKAIGEAMLRSRAGEREELLELLGGGRAAFDGHKGAPLHFSGPDGTLAQPLYVVSGTETTEMFWPMEEATDGH